MRPTVIGSVGIAAIDAEGKVVLTTRKLLRGCGSAEPAEAEACLEGLQLAEDLVKYMLNP
jgi:hypothetical protein